MKAIEANSNWSMLMAAAQAGNAGLYRTLLNEVSKWLRRYFARRLPPGMVDDAVQDTLLAIHEKRHTYDPSRPFELWLAGIARYKWIDRLRAMKAAPTEPVTEDLPVPDHGEAVLNAHAVEQLLAELKPEQAWAIRLVKLHGLSVEEASALTGQSASLVKVNIHRGLARLTARLRGHPNAE